LRPPSTTRGERSAAWQTHGMATIVLTVIGDDRAGLVDALAEPIAAHGGSWDRSHMARLAGKFAGIVVVSVPDERTDDLAADLAALTTRGLLDVTFAIAADSADAPTARDGVLELHLIGHDRPGIIREIANALARRDVSIEELETSSSSAPMSGELLFEATASLRVPAAADPDDLRAALEAIANELMVDLAVSEAAPDRAPPTRGGDDDRP
jgi:glycine cleavage system regulatory protein